MVVVTSFPPPTEGIRHEEPSTRVIMQDKDLGMGTMYITESCLSWVDSASDKGFSLEYPHISLHAVSKDLESYPHECLYIMLDTTLLPPGEQNGDEGSDEEAEGDGLTEIRFIPENKGSLERMFSALTYCQTLHPDPADSISPDEDEESYEEDDDEALELGPDGDRLGIGHNGHAHPDMEVDGQFEDAAGDN